MMEVKITVKRISDAEPRYRITIDDYADILREDQLRTVLEKILPPELVDEIKKMLDEGTDEFRGTPRLSREQVKAIEGWEAIRRAIREAGRK